MKKNNLHKAILAALSVSAMAAYSTQANAFNSTNIGTFTGATISVDSTTPFRAFADYEARNQGWIHTGRYFTLAVGDATDISNGATFDVQLKMTGRGALDLGNFFAAINNPSFAVWTAGTGAINTSAVRGQGHGWNPTRGIDEIGVDVNGDSGEIWTNTMMGAAGVLSGHEGLIGYVNSGPTYTLINYIDPLGLQPQTETGAEVHDAVSHGALNTTSLTWLTNPAGSSTSYTNDYYRDGSGGPTVGTAPDYAMMILSGLKAGNYLIGLGGSCPNFPDTVAASDACGYSQQFTFEVSAAPVPVPGAVWLFGSAIAGLVGVSKRKQKALA